MTYKKLTDMWFKVCNAVYEISDVAEMFESSDEIEREDVRAIKEMCDKLIEVLDEE